MRPPENARDRRASRALPSLLGLVCLLLPGGAGAASITSLVISEALFDPTGSDDAREWIELYNGTGASIDLSGYSLGWGGVDYTAGLVQLSGTIAADATFVIGGPVSNGSNDSPTFDQLFDFEPDLGNAEGGVADGIALFDLLAADVTPTSVPIHAVIYGTTNSNNLIDETGGVGAVHVGTGKQGMSIEYLGGANWVPQPAPSPGSRSPEPSSGLLVGTGLVVLAAVGRSPRARSPSR